MHDDQDGTWAAPAAAGPVSARIWLPASKSITNRALVLAALSDRPARIANPLRARDTLLAAAALRAMGTEVADDAGPVVVAYPLGFDWMWLYWYFMRFADAGSPFSFSQHLDMKTIYATKARTTVSRSTKRRMPVSLRPSRPHTHNALDDAIEQAELFQKLFSWDGPDG